MDPRRSRFDLEGTLARREEEPRVDGTVESDVDERLVEAHVPTHERVERLVDGLLDRKTLQDGDPATVFGEAVQGRQLFVAQHGRGDGRARGLVIFEVHSQAVAVRPRNEGDGERALVTDRPHDAMGQLWRTAVVCTDGGECHTELSGRCAKRKTPAYELRLAIAAERARVSPLFGRELGEDCVGDGVCAVGKVDGCENAVPHALVVGDFEGLHPTSLSSRLDARAGLPLAARSGGRLEPLLVITEKPSVARDIGAALGGFEDGDECLVRSDLVITWAVGHLLELCEPQDYDPALRSWSLKLLPILPEQFRVKPRDGQKKRLDGIKRLARRASGLVNACDAGREGELIYRRIVEYLELGHLPQQRLWLQSMTHGAIRQAFSQLQPAANYERLGDAAWLRSVGDWLVGMNATRALTQRLKSRNEVASWSAGRVQTPTLAMLVGREHEILAHRPRPYRVLRARFSGGDPAHDWEGRFVDPRVSSDDRDVKADRIFDLPSAVALADAVRAAGTGVASERRKRARQSPPLPFDLTTLQREANRRSGMSAKRTLDAAQRLYEQHKLTTYPRTDSRHLPSDYGATVAGVLEALATGGLGETSAVAASIVASGPQNLAVVLDDKGVSDHFAIVPTGNLPAGELSGDDARVWDLVLRQFLACWMGPATWATVEREVVVAGHAGPATFRASSRTLEIPGFLTALGQEASDEQRLPPLAPGQDAPKGVTAAVLGVDMDDKSTTPPPRLSEAQLLRMMEAAGEEIDDAELSEAVAGRGLGTPATRAEVIERLVSGADAYARRVEGRLMPTHKGIKLVDVLTRVDAGALASPRLTGEWEYALREVEHGRRERAQVLDGLVSTTRDLAARLRDADLKALYAASPPVGPCPSCGAPVGENPWGYPCSRNAGVGEGCDFILWKDRSGRYVDRDLASRLLVERRATDVEGLVDRAGRLLPPATLTLRRDEGAGRWTVDFATGDAAVDEAPETIVGELGPCPSHEDCVVVESTRRYACQRQVDGRDRQGPALPRVVCAREITAAEALPWFGEAGRTALLEGFVSRRGRPFKGMLVRKATGKYGFEFPERPERPGRPARGATAGKSKAAPKAAPEAEADAPSKVARAKAATKKAAPKAASKKAAAKAATKKAVPKKASPRKASTRRSPKVSPRASPKADKPEQLSG